MHVVIDGQEYLPAKQYKKHLIGIGITTHNRPKLIKDTVDRVLAVTPNAKIVVVDDASETRPDVQADVVYSFRHNVGIARAKNKCLELLADCEHIFLFDDDCYPIKPDWYIPYIESKEHHLMYLFESWANGKPVGDDSVIYEDGNIVAHSQARGCMLYVDKTVLETVGGMDVRYGKAMHEHLDYSTRIYNAGLTTFHYMDVPNSSNLICSLDQQQAVSSSVPTAERRMMLHRNNQLLIDAKTSTRFAPYGKDVVIACYFSGVLDVQRNTKWPADIKAINKLKQSVESRGCEFVLIHNCFDLPNLTTISGSPYFERWLKEWQYLRDHPEINNVFVVDATDVDMVKNPFQNMSAGTLYVGDEPNETLANNWLLTRHQEPRVNNWLRAHKELQMLNCGVVGGTRELVMNICRDMYDYHFEHPHEQTEMGIFNMVCHSKYADIIEYGRNVTSLFKKYERTTNAWWRHK